VCRETRGENGGMIDVGEVRKRVEKGRGIGGGIEVSEYVHVLPLPIKSSSLSVTRVTVAYGYE